MGCADFAGIGLGLASAKAKEEAELRSLKAGKTPEQQMVIDFFFAQSGCLGRSSSSMTINEYKQLVSKKCQSLNLMKRALEKTGLDESQVREIEPIVLSSFHYGEGSHVKAIDNNVVSSQYSVGWIFFTQDQLITYSYILDMTSNNSWESSKDFFYKDITSISVSRERKDDIRTEITGCIKGKPSTSITTYVYDTLSIIVPGDNATFSIRNSATMEKSIQAAKQMIREKKFSR